MANRLKGDIEISLGGRKLLLRPTFEGLVEAEGRAGVGLSVILRNFAKSEWSLKHIVSVIAGGLYHYGDPKLSFENVGNEIVSEGMKEFIMPAVTLISKSVSPVKGDAEEEPEKKDEPGLSS